MVPLAARVREARETGRAAGPNRRAQVEGIITEA